MTQRWTKPGSNQQFRKTNVGSDARSGLRRSVTGFQAPKSSGETGGSSPVPSSGESATKPLLAYPATAEVVERNREFESGSLQRRVMANGSHLSQERDQVFESASLQQRQANSGLVTRTGFPELFSARGFNGFEGSATASLS